MKLPRLMQRKGRTEMGADSTAKAWPMTFVGGSLSDGQMPLCVGDRPNSLASAIVGDCLEILEVRAGQPTLKQLRRVGLQPGQRVTVLSCADSGSVIVNCTKGTVGLGAAIAQHVIVTPVAEANAQRPQALSMQSPAILPAS